MKHKIEGVCADKTHKIRVMPNRCVVGGCSNVANPKESISLHFIPFSGDERPEAKRRRKQWVDFVRLKRAKWEPTPNSSVCSEHFEKKDFCDMFATLSNKKPRLVCDEVGVVAIRKNVIPDNKALSARDKRKVRILFSNPKLFLYFNVI